MKVTVNVDEKDKPEFLGCKLWILSVFFAAFIMGTGLYIYSKNFSYMGFVGTAFLAPIPLLVFCSIKIGMAIRNKINLGTFINPKMSNIIDEDGNYKKINLVALLGSWYANTAHIFLLTFAFKFAKLGGINPGVVIVLVVFATIFNTFTFYFGFGEIPTKIKFFGMSFVISSTVFLGINAA